MKCFNVANFLQLDFLRMSSADRSIAEMLELRSFEPGSEEYPDIVRITSDDEARQFSLHNLVIPTPGRKCLGNLLFSKWSGPLDQMKTERVHLEYPFGENILIQAGKWNGPLSDLEGPSSFTEHLYKMRRTRISFIIWWSFAGVRFNLGLLRFNGAWNRSIRFSATCRSQAERFNVEFCQRAGNSKVELNVSASSKLLRNRITCGSYGHTPAKFWFSKTEIISCRINERWHFRFKVHK